MKVMWRFAWLVALVCALVPLSFGQGREYAKWSASFEPTDIRAGESGRVLIRVEIEEPWYMYGTKVYSSDNPLDTFPTSTTITLKPNDLVEQNGKLVLPKPLEKIDKNFNDLQVEYFEDQVVFAVPVKVKEGVQGKVKLDLAYTYQACKKGLCDIPRYDQPLTIEFEVQPGEARDVRLAALTALPNQPAQTSGDGANAEKDGSGSSSPDELPLGAYLLFCFGAGLASLLLPCVFPMIPITVSFFSKQKPGEERKTNYAGAIAYCLGIISTFTGLGLLVTVLFGATGIQNLATNAWVNLLMFIVFVALGLSLFGLFNIGLPSGLVNKVSAKSRMGGFVGPILMGLTFTLTSFTCTVPVVGTLLVSAAKGDIWRPLVGMLTFSSAFALPFFFLALFPSVLSKMPRSGTWMNTVKVFMAFLELAFAVKFLSNIDVVYQWGLITKPVALGIWFSLAVMAGAYLLGWLRLGNESGDLKVGWIRRGFGVATLVGGVLCLAAMEGYSLGKVGALLPPDPYPYKDAARREKGVLAWGESYDEALAKAKELGKPVFLNFTGYTCTNCRDMEQNMFPQAEVKQELDEMVLLELYTDGKEPIHKQNQELQQKLTGSVTLPIYVVLSPDGEVVGQFAGSTDNRDEFVKFIQAGKSKVGAVVSR
jgi:thiol:disulfide interchange protein